MNTLRIFGTRQIMALCRQPWPPCPATAPRLDLAERVEEEKTPYYRRESFYQARLGEILNGRYQLATKLGYGSGSTVWLARDLHRCVLSLAQPRPRSV